MQGRRLWRVVVAAALLGADQASKAWARRSLAPRGTVWLWRPWLSLQLVYNPGATLGVGADHARLLTVLAAVATVVLLGILWRAERGVAGWTLVLAGAAGNLASRLAQGAVTDFIHVWFWPGIFNLADVFLRLGAVLVVLALFRVGRPQPGMAVGRTGS